MNLTETLKSEKHGDSGYLEYPKFPVQFSNIPSQVEMVAPPLLGEHTEIVLREQLKYSQDKIEWLKIEKVI